MHRLSYWDEVEDAQIELTKRILLNQGRIRFGDPDRKNENALNRIKELARLERMTGEILRVNTWKELLAVR